MYADEGETAPTPAPTVSAVTIDPPTPAALDVGKTMELSAAVSYTDEPQDTDEAAKLNRTVTWTSASPSIATVDDKGVVTAVTPGEAKITAASKADPTKTAECTVAVSGVTLSKTSVTLLVGRTESLTYSTFGTAAGKSIVWTTSNPSVAEVFGGSISAHYEGTATITATANATGYTAECSVTVKKDEAEAIRSSVDGASPLAFSSFLSTLRSRCTEKTGGSLSYLSSISVSPKQGVLYYGYVSADAPGHGVGGSEKYYYAPGNGQEGISEISFVAASDFSGTAEIAYTGYASNGGSFHGTILVNVSGDSDATYTASAGRALTFTSEEFIAVCQSRTGRSISYLTFDQPNAYQGTLYYDYSAAAPFSQQVRSDTRYYVTSNPSLDRISFVPADGFTGTVTIPYRCTDSSGGIYNGKVTIRVSAANGSTGSTDVSYAATVGRGVSFKPEDFNAASIDYNGTSLNYVKFDLPAASEGVLYYNYTGSGSYTSRVDSSARYYRSGSSPRISGITFVPAAGFSGTVTIPYTGYQYSGSFTGRVVIRVSGDDGVVSYTTTRSKAVYFEAAYFNELCLRDRGRSFSRVSFELPASSQGTLYYNYASSYSSSKVSASTSYYRSGSPGVSNVCFVPAGGFTGVVSIPFSGYDDGGSRWSGTVRIVVDNAYGAEVVRYSVPQNGYIRFDADDFNDACLSIIGERLSYVRFEQPSARRGTLYSQYSVSGKSNIELSSSANCYRSGSSRLIDDVTFAAATGFSGTVTIDYTGRSTNSKTYTGTVEISVGISAAAPDFLLPFSDVNPTAYYYEPIRWAVYNGIAEGVSQTRFGVNEPCSRARIVTFLWRAAGSPMPRSTLTPFVDVLPGSYYYQAVLWAVENGITNGTGAATFSPEMTVSRAQAMTYLHRSAGLVSSSYYAPFTDVSDNAYYASAVRWALSRGITNGTSATTFSPDEPCTRSQIVTFLYRAQAV